MVKPGTESQQIRDALEDIARFALALPDVVESTSYGQPALKRNTRLVFALRKDLETLALVCGFKERQALMKAYPEAFFITDHYLNYPSVVVRLAKVKRHVLRKAVGAAWERLGAQTTGKRRVLGARRTSSRR